MNETTDYYNLDTILGYYDTMPPKLKNATSMIVFENIDKDNNSQLYSPKYKTQNVITITNKAFESEKVPDLTLERVLTHEMSHCINFEKLNRTEKSIVSAVLREDSTKIQKLMFQKILLTKTNKYSKIGTDFYNATENENWRMSSTYANDWQTGQGMYDENIRLNEHFTETVSMVAFKNKEDKSNAKIKDVNGEYIGYDEFISKHPHIVPVIENIIF